jgi:outer membrane protein TolC
MVVVIVEMAQWLFGVRTVVLALVVLPATCAVAAAQDTVPAPLPGGPLTLEQVLGLAEARSEALGIARSGVQRAQGEQLRARSGRFPQLTASGSYDRALASEFSGIFGADSTGPPCPPFALDPAASLAERVAEIERAIDCGAIGSSLFGGGSGEGGEDVDLPFGRKNTWRVNLAFSQAIYSGGRLDAQADLAAIGSESAQLAFTTARGQLLYDVTRAFYDAALSERLVRIAEATLAQAEATVQQVQAGFDAGAQPEFELLRARVARDNQQPALIRQRAAREIAMLRLKQLLDLPAAFPLEILAALEGPNIAVPEPFAGRVATETETSPTPKVLPSRTAVREVESVVRLREASLRLTEAERRPSLSVNSNYSRVAYPNGAFPTGDFRTNWTVGASVQVPILTGGRQRGSEAVARAELDQARLQLRQAQELAELDARSAHAELVAARAAFDASAGTVGQAVRAYEIAEVRFQSGVSTQLELSDARLLLQQAEANRAQAARDLQIARARVALLEDLPLGTVSGQSPAAITPASSSSSSPSQQQQQRQPGGGSGGMQ